LKDIKTKKLNSIGLKVRKTAQKRREKTQKTQ